MYYSLMHLFHQEFVDLAYPIIERLIKLLKLDLLTEVLLNDYLIYLILVNSFKVNNIEDSCFMLFPEIFNFFKQCNLGNSLGISCTPLLEISNSVSVDGSSVK